jgi:hypothetical protein
LKARGDFPDLTGRVAGVETPAFRKETRLSRREDATGECHLVAFFFHNLRE